MKQEEIKALLEEAAKPTCSSVRRNDIHCRLSEASAAMGENGVYEVDNPEAGLIVLLDRLFISTLKNRPELLPTLFPAFAVICGDRDEDLIIAQIDWSLV
ncbi:MAG: hypothetical protein WCX71_00985 [Candidatus Buchananbacteria bacterium]